MYIVGFLKNVFTKGGEMMGREKGESAFALCFAYVVKLHKVSAFSWVFYLLQRVCFFLPRFKVAQFYFFFNLTEGAAVCVFFFSFQSGVTILAPHLQRSKKPSIFAPHLQRRKNKSRFCAPYKEEKKVRPHPQRRRTI